MWSDGAVACSGLIKAARSIPRDARAGLDQREWLADDSPQEGDSPVALCKDESGRDRGLRRLPPASLTAPRGAAQVFAWSGNGGAAVRGC